MIKLKTKTEDADWFLEPPFGPWCRIWAARDGVPTMCWLVDTMFKIGFPSDELRQEVTEYMTPTTQNKLSHYFEKVKKVVERFPTLKQNDVFEISNFLNGGPKC